MRIDLFRKQYHPSWMLMWLCFGFILGITMPHFLVGKIDLKIIFALTLTLFTSSLFARRTIVALLLVVLAGVGIGFARAEPLRASIDDYSVYIGREIVVKGAVSEDVSYGPKGAQHVTLKDIEIDGVKLPGKIWASVNSDDQIKRSDLIIVYGKTSAGFGIMPMAMYEASVVDIYSDTFSDTGRSVRDWFAGKIRASIGEPEASLGIGYLVGQRSLLPQDINDAMRALGLTHVVVASGYNLTILVRFTRRLFAKTSKYTAFMTAVIMVFSFIMMTGASPSMTRAALVTCISLMAWYFGRNIQPMILLALVGAITACINPFYVWGDLGWYLSMLSFVGIMIISPLIKAYFFEDSKKIGWHVGLVVETLSAQIATFPLIAYIFGQYSILSLPANLLIVPLVPVAMAATFFAGLVSTVLPVSNIITHLPATIILEYMTTIVRYLASSPYASSEIKISMDIMIISYVLMIILLIYMKKVTQFNFGQENIIK